MDLDEKCAEVLKNCWKSNKKHRPKIGDVRSTLVDRIVAAAEETEEEEKLNLSRHQTKRLPNNNRGGYLTVVDTIEPVDESVHMEGEHLA